MKVVFCKEKGSYRSGTIKKRKLYRVKFWEKFDKYFLKFARFRGSKESINVLYYEHLRFSKKYLICQIFNLCLCNILFLRAKEI